MRILDTDEYEAAGAGSFSDGVCFVMEISKINASLV